MKRKKLRSIKAIKRDLDNAFSLFVRRRDADENGMGRCVTCFRWAKLEAGHFIPRQYVSTRWLEINCAGQCSFCNRWMHGAQAEFYVALVKQHGQSVVNELMQAKHRTVKFSRDELNEMLTKFKEKT